MNHFIKKLAYWDGLNVKLAQQAAAAQQTPSVDPDRYFNSFADAVRKKEIDFKRVIDETCKKLEQSVPLFTRIFGGDDKVREAKDYLQSYGNSVSEAVEGFISNFLQARSGAENAFRGLSQSVEQLTKLRTSLAYDQRSPFFEIKDKINVQDLLKDIFENFQSLYETVQYLLSVFYTTIVQNTPTPQTTQAAAPSAPAPTAATAPAPAAASTAVAPSVSAKKQKITSQEPREVLVIDENGSDTQVTSYSPAEDYLISSLNNINKEIKTKPADKARLLERAHSLIEKRFANLKEQQSKGSVTTRQYVALRENLENIAQMMFAASFNFSKLSEV